MASNDGQWGGNAAAADKPKLTKILSEKFSKTKVVASAGFAKTKVAGKKVKDGAAVGVNWIKLKYKLFQKK